MKRAILAITLLVVVGVFIYFAMYLFSDSQQNKEFEDTYREIQSIAIKAGANPNQSPDGEFVDQPAIDFDALLAINPDTVAWLEIPGTSINYPVVQSENDSYYEKHDFNKKRAACGAIFAQSNNSFPEPFDKNTVLYGHNMSSSSTLMFSPLRGYKDRTSFEEHRRINLYTPTGNSRWRVVAVCHLSIDVLTDFNFIQTTYEDSNEYISHVEQLQARSMYGRFEHQGDEPELLTLITCDRKTYGKKGRLVIVAVREDR